jgi:hypothetical protein
MSHEGGTVLSGSLHDFRVSQRDFKNAARGTPRPVWVQGALGFASAPITLEP